jgi:hypothetical protein
MRYESRGSVWQEANAVAVEKEARLDEIARSFSALMAGANEVVKGLWMTTDRGGITFWILTGPIDPDTQDRLYERTVKLYDQFPDLLFDVHILNPEWFAGGDALSALPHDAQPIPLPAA